MRWLLLLLFFLPLSGCIGDSGSSPSPLRPGVPAAEMEVGTAYAFDHPGGAMTWRQQVPGATMDFTLFGPDDARIATLRVGGMGQAEAPNLELPRGVYVVYLIGGSGELELRAGDKIVERFQPLPVHLERLPLVARIPSSLDLLSFVQPRPVDEGFVFDFDRAPLGMRLRHSGGYDDLLVTVTGPGGMMMFVQSVGAGQTFADFQGFQDIHGDFALEASRPGPTTVEVKASHVDGALVLEYWTYSRATPIPGLEVLPLPLATFQYGTLPPGPTAFEVAGDAELLLFRPDSVASLLLFGPDDRLLDGLQLDAATAVRVEGGRHVAVLLSGEVSVEADRAPADFALRPLATTTVEVTPPGGSQGQYRQANATASGGTPYALDFAFEAPSGFELPLTAFGACDAPALVRVEEDGEAIFSVDLASTSTLPMFLPRGGEVEVSVDGFGGDCGTTTVHVHLYVD